MYKYCEEYALTFATAQYFVHLHKDENEKAGKIGSRRDAVADFN